MPSSAKCCTNRPRSLDRCLARTRNGAQECRTSPAARLPVRVPASKKSSVLGHTVKTRDWRVRRRAPRGGGPRAVVGDGRGERGRPAPRLAAQTPLRGSHVKLRPAQNLEDVGRGFRNVCSSSSALRREDSVRVNASPRRPPGNGRRPTQLTNRRGQRRSYELWLVQDETRAHLDPRTCSALKRCCLFPPSHFL